MNNIELSSIESIVDDDMSLDALVKAQIGFEEGHFRFILPIGTNQEVKQKLDIFCSKMNLNYERYGRATKLFPCEIKEPVVISEPVPEPVAAPESEPLPEPAPEPAPAPAPLKTSYNKRKK